MNDNILYTLSDTDIYDLIYKTYFACLKFSCLQVLEPLFKTVYFIAYTYDITNKKRHQNCIKCLEIMNKE